MFNTYSNDAYGSYIGRFTTLAADGQTTLDSAAVPDPCSLVLFCLGLIGFAALSCKLAKSKNA